MAAIFPRVTFEADAMCGTTTQLGSLTSGWSAGSGSGSVTSRPAAKISPDRSAWVSASGSMTGPREVFTSTALGFMARSASESMR
jgi:hypothetical protein